MRDDTCPFCTQPLSDIGIIDLFRQYFSGGYEDQVVAVQRAINELDQAFAENALTRLQKQVVENDGRIQTWYELADMSFASVSLDRLEGSWKHLKQTLGAALQKKLANPAEPPANDSEIEAALQDYESTASQVLEHGKEITRANDQIAQLKQQAAASDEAKLEVKLRKLRNTQIRAESEVVALCDELKELRTQKANLNREKTEKRDQLRTESETLLSEYEADINALLSRFGASFRITGTRPHFAGGPASSTYKLEVNGVPLDLGDSRTPRGTPCFRTALSAGDKSTLALAFFLARLQRDPRLNEKIVVFDDPLSSLDCFRSTFTQQAVARLAKRSVQVIVLSHDPFFLKGISDAAEGVATKSMRVARSGETATLREWDVDDYCLAQAHKDYFVLRNFLDNGLPDGGDLETVARAIRPYVEGYPRHRNPDRFPAGQMLGALIEAIREVAEGDDLATLKPKLSDLEDINGYARRFMHDQAASGAAQPTSDTELRTYVTRAMDFVRGA